MTFDDVFSNIFGTPSPVGVDPDAVRLAYPVGDAMTPHQRGAQYARRIGDYITIIQTQGDQHERK